MKKNSLLLFFLLTVVGMTSAQVNKYKISHTSGTYTSISNTGSTVLPLDYDDETGTIPIGFSFTFDGRVYTDAIVSGNGFIAFGGNAPTGAIFRPISTAGYDGIVSAFGTDLWSDGSTPVYYQLSGTTPNRVLTVEWKNAEPLQNGLPTANEVNFQIQLFEGSNDIHIVYGDFIALTTSAGQVGLRGASLGQFVNARDMGEFDTPYFGYLATHRMEFTDVNKPTAGRTFIFDFCNTCQPKYWAGVGSQLDSPTTGTDLSVAANWSSTGPQGAITATTAPQAGDSLIGRFDRDLTLTQDMQVQAISFYHNYLGTPIRLLTSDKQLHVTGTLSLDLVADQPNNNDIGILIGDGTNPNSGGLIVDGDILLGTQSESDGAAIDISAVAGTEKGLELKGDFVLGANASTSFFGGLKLTMSGVDQRIVSNNESLTPASTTNLNTLEIGNGTSSTTLYLEGSSNVVMNANTSGATEPAVTIKNNAILDLEDKLLNRNATLIGAAPFRIEDGGSMRLKGTTGGVQGSNFPNNFSVYQLEPGSTVEYYSDEAQEIAAENYGHLVSSSTGARTIAGNIRIANDFTSGTNAYATAGSRIRFNGSGAQHLTGDLGSTTSPIDVLEVDNSSTALTDGLILNADIELSELLLMDGLLQLNGKAVNLTSTAAGSLDFTDGAFANSANDFSGKLVWTVNDVTGLRTVPFVDATGGNDARIALDLKTGDAEKLTFSSYYTGADNTPLPNGVASLPGQGGSDAANNTVDRFFLIEQSSTNTLESDISLNYAAGEKPTTSTQLEAQRFGTSSWDAPLASQVYTSADDSLFIPAVADLGVFAIVDQAPVPLVAGFTAAPTTVCAGQTVQYTSSATGNVTSYSWSFPGGTPATSTDANPLVTYNTAGSYDASLTVGDGATTDMHTETAFVTVNDLPTAVISGGGNTCTGNSVLDIALTGVGPWDITIDDGTTQTPITGITSSPYQHQVSTDGTYTLVDVLDANCTGTVSGSATVTTVAGVSISNIQENCNGNEYTVSFEITGGDPASYNVSGGNGTLTGNTFVSDLIPSGQAYTFTADDANSCSPQTISNTVSCGCPAAADIAGIDSICSGETGMVEITLTGTAPFDFEYSDGSNTQTVTGITQNTYQIFGNVSTTYTMVSMNDATCAGVVSGTAEIRQFAFPTVSIDDEDICEGDMVTITPVVDLPGGDYDWSNGETTPTVDLSPITTESFTLSYTKDGCETTESFDVNVTAAPLTPTISITGLTLTSDVAVGNQWYKDGAVIPGATNDTYIVSENGVYTSIVSNGDCDSDVSNEIEVTNVGIGELQVSDYAKVYPNPTSGNFTLEMSTQITADITNVSIVNVLGQTVRTLDVKQTQKVDISDLNPGVYFVNIQSDKEAASLRLIRR